MASHQRRPTHPALILLAGLLFSCGRDEAIGRPEALPTGGVASTAPSAASAGAETAENGGQAGEATAGGAGGSAAGTTADVEGGAPGTRGCSASSDCVQTRFYKPVLSEADCYCPLCAGDFGRQPPLNRETHALYEEQWLALCPEWLATPPCFSLPCPLLSPPLCHAGQCDFRPE